SRIATVHPDGSLHVYDLPAGRRALRLPLGIRPDSFSGVAWHPEGHQVAVIRGKEVILIDAAAGQELAKLDHSKDLHHVSWSASGRLLATGSLYPEVRVWDVAGRRPVSEWVDTQGRSYVSLNRDGELLATRYAWGFGMKLWHPGTGKLLLNIPEIGGGS